MNDGSGRFVRPGGELWSFIAPEFFPEFLQLRDNSQALTLGTSVVPGVKGTSGKHYFFDGTTTVYQDLRDANNPKTYIYLTARRGGRFIYAFDVSDPKVAPKLLWQKSDANIPELGQTWSQPKLALVGTYPNPVLVMGGGYDTNEDIDPAPVGDTMGRAIVVLDAFSGAPLWTACPSGCTTAVAKMTYAIPSDVALFDADGNGLTDRLYVGDLGGNIWRADISGDASSISGTVTQLASLGGTGTSARKFFFPPDVTPATGFDVVVATSGDREHPLLANASSTVINRYYMLKDTNTTAGAPSSWALITEAALLDNTAALTGGTPYPSTSTTQGFYITFAKGEKAVNAPLNVAGYTRFGTNTPISNPNTCSANLGEARGYAINFLTGAGLNDSGFVKFDGGGLPPSPVFALVAINPATPTVLTPVLIGGGNQTGPGGGNNSSALGANMVTPPNTGKRQRTYWYTEDVK